MPKTPSDLIDRTLAEIERQNGEIRALAALGSDSLLARTIPEKWCVAEHFEHLSLTNADYLDVIEPRIAAARAAGTTGEGPFRRKWLGSWFAGTLEPPVKMKVTTLKRLVPPADLDVEAVVARLLETQGRVGAAADSARGLDLGRVSFSSPFLSLLRLDLGLGFDVMMAHNRRHLWLCERTLEAGEGEG